MWHRDHHLRVELEISHAYAKTLNDKLLAANLRNAELRRITRDAIVRAESKQARIETLEAEVAALTPPPADYPDEAFVFPPLNNRADLVPDYDKLNEQELNDALIKWSEGDL